MLSEPQEHVFNPFYSKYCLFSSHRVCISWIGNESNGCSQPASCFMLCHSPCDVVVCSRWTRISLSDRVMLQLNPPLSVLSVVERRPCDSGLSVSGELLSCSTCPRIIFYIFRLSEVNLFLVYPALVWGTEDRRCPLIYQSSESKLTSCCLLRTDADDPTLPQSAHVAVNLMRTLRQWIFAGKKMSLFILWISQEFSSSQTNYANVIFSLWSACFCEVPLSLKHLESNMRMSHSEKPPSCSVELVVQQLWCWWSFITQKTWSITWIGATGPFYLGGNNDKKSRTGLLLQRWIQTNTRWTLTITHYTPVTVHIGRDTPVHLSVHRQYF